ncbi:LuxR family transcriptional regulator [Actinophytocola sp.]|uniref:helix-turn-helix transcriptional regulator n=1 Tax=Actinophytocola sp. TaxID=1872138 RepID=UPI002D3A8CDD|nr:LuxR family transcriptional regulator [Actinophytocola sp.]HYQ66944.1 LuxR family transcriptional regulator [Actinophytocola sp.]
MSPVLRGRDAEVGRLRELLDAARDGRGTGVVVLGEGGTGKTAVLAALPSAGVTTLAVRGVPAERDLPFGGLHRLLSPVASLFEELPEALRDAVRGSADGMPLRCGVYELLCRLATRRPVLCRVDDAQWLDTQSLEVLGFAARRLAGQRVLLVLAARPELVRPACDAVAGVERLWLPPLPDAACEQLLRDRIDRDVPAGLRAVIRDLAGGNPLDLVALAESLTPDQLAGRAPLPDELPEGTRRADYRARVAALSPAARHALVCAAAESTVDLTVLRRLGDVDALLAAGLLRAEGTPLPSKVVGSTLYALASPAERRAAHAALAAELTGPERTWHRAALSPSARLGDELAATARSANPATAATLLERAAALAVAPSVRDDRLLAAARHAWRAGRPGWARLLLTRSSTVDDGRRALLHGEMELRDGDPAVATHELATAAARLTDPDEVTTALLLSGEARRLRGDLPGYLAMARSADHLDHFAGLSAVFEGRYADAVEPLRRVIDHGRAADDVGPAVWAAEAAFALGRGEDAFEWASAAVSRARLTGRESLLPWALVQFALAAIVLDRHDYARSAAAEGLAAAAGQRNTWVEHLSLLGLSAALRGDRDTALSMLDTAAPGIAERALGRPGAIVSWAHACLDLADDRPADALGRLESMAAGVSGAQPAVQVLATPLLVEAAVLVGRPDRAHRALVVFDRWALAGGSPAWLALSHRCHGLLATDPAEAEQRFTTAIALHRTAGAAMELARTQLAYARRLRRHRRTRDARAQFRDALRVFEIAGADRCAEKARAGLRATGATVTGAGDAVAGPDPRLIGLTPQQAEISRLVADGETNKEIARRLVISHRTVDHHLRNIFTALGVRSRVELARRVTSMSGPDQ